MSPLRDVDTRDLDRLLELQGRCFGDEAWTRGMLAEELDRPGGIFLGVGRPLLGFVCGWAVLDELHLLQIGVDPDVRRTGLATRLHQGLLDRARGRAEAGWLELRADNAAAYAFYSRHRWVLVGRRPRYYADGADALVLRLDPLYQLAAE